MGFAQPEDPSGIVQEMDFLLLLLGPGVDFPLTYTALPHWKRDAKTEP